MPFSIRCSGCESALNVAENLIGKTIKCNKCGEMITVRAPAAAKAPSAVAARPSRAAVVEDDDDSILPAKAPRRQMVDDDDFDNAPRKKGAKAAAVEGRSKAPLLIGGLVALLLVAGGAGAYFAFFNDKKDETTQNTGTNTPPPSKSPVDATGKTEEGDKTAEGDAKADEGTKPTDAKDEKKADSGEKKKADPPIATSPLSNPPPSTTPAGQVSAPPSSSADYMSKLMSGFMDEITLSRVKRAVVMIAIETPLVRATGSGWFGLEPGIIFTNAHVLEMLAPGSKPPSKITIYVNAGENGQTPGLMQRNIEHNRIKVLAVDRDMDLAILQIVGEKDLPEPLKIRQSAELRQRQGVTVVGFPLGSLPGESTGNSKQPQVSVRTSSIAALRYNDHGALRRVQIEGGQSSGNSGGPIIDAEGFVVAVCVESLVADRRISFGVPTESVLGLLAGEIMDIEYEQPYLVGENVHVPVKAICADPFGRLKSVGVGTWIGDASATFRPPGNKRSGALASDKDFKQVELKYNAEKKVATGELIFRNLAPGLSYWVQPYYSNRMINPYWMSGQQLPMSGPPVDRVMASLRVNLRSGVVRPITLSREVSFDEAIEGQGEAKNDRLFIKTTIKGTERIYDPDRNDQRSAARTRLTYNDIDIKGVNNEGVQTGRVPPELLLLLKRGINEVEAYGYLNRQGEMYRFTTNTFASNNPVAQILIPEFSNSCLAALQVCSIPLPNKDVQPLETWTTGKNIPFQPPTDPASQGNRSGPPQRGGAGGRGNEQVRVREWKYTQEMTYTYLGSRTRGGKKEAVVKVEGKALPAAGQAKDSVHGEIKGYAFIDINSGIVVESGIETEFELDSSELGIKKKMSMLDKYRITRGGPTN